MFNSFSVRVDVLIIPDAHKNPSCFVVKIEKINADTMSCSKCLCLVLVEKQEL